MEHELILEKARLRVRRHFARHMPAQLTFHDLEHTLSVTRYALEIGRAEGLSIKDLYTLELAALYHDTGYAHTHAGHEARSTAIAEEQLTDLGVPSAVIGSIKRTILATRLHAVPRTKLQRILRDADSAKAGQADFHTKAMALRTELEHVLGKKISAKAWTLENIAYLDEHQFHTTYAQERFGRQKELNKTALRQQLEKQRRPMEPGLRADPFFDRDLSWLAFNARVLQEAQKDSTPLLERLKFLAIHSSNLDEFYRVRVAQHRSMVVLGKTERSALQVPAEKHLQRINRTALAQQQRFGRILRTSILPALADHGIQFLQPKQLNTRQRKFVERFVEEHVLQHLTVSELRPGHAPFIEDRRPYLIGEIPARTPAKRKLLLVNVPSDELGRFLLLPTNKGNTGIMYLEDAIRACSARVFRSRTPVNCYAVKLSRDAELYLDEEFAANVVDKVRRSLRKRRTGVPARFLYDTETPPRMLRRLRALLDIRKADMIPGGRYHNLSDLMDLPIAGHEDLREPALPPLEHPAFKHGTDPFTAIAQGDILLHYPYQSFNGFTRVLEHAANDPAVTAIGITLYRVAKESTVCQALLQARAKGKKVQVHVEVQARFDEGNNLAWGERLAASGAQVTYGSEGLKVHAKLCCITRSEQGKARYYAYLGTGNFNEKTARIYGDMGLWTAHRTMTSDVQRTLLDLAKPGKKTRTALLLLAPDDLRVALERRIDTEIANAISGQPASIFLKMNSLEDHPLIRKLYDASRAGVQVRLIVRGICCLVPGVEGHSTRIAAISIVDRFLEHVRAYVFHNGGEPEVLLSSADWMTRNMDRRVEAAFPVLDPVLRQEVIDHLEGQWKDNVKARIIDKQQRNRFRPRAKGKKAVRSQTVWYERLSKA